jgi:hypothetical protein
VIELLYYVVKREGGVPFTNWRTQPWTKTGILRASASGALFALLLLALPNAAGATPVKDHSPAPRSIIATGYNLVAADGGVFVFGGGFYGSLPGLGVRVDNIVGMVPSSDYRGYFLVGSDGGVFSFGDTQFEGSLPGLGVRVSNIVGLVPTSDDHGYFLVGSDGGVFAFGDASFEGSLPGLGERVSDVTAIASTPDNAGYWVVEKGGNVTNFGDAPNLIGGEPLVNWNDNPYYVDISATNDGQGYWVLDSWGTVWVYGDAQYFGDEFSVYNPFGSPHNGNVVSLVPTADSLGYWIIGSDGSVYTFGDAPNFGSLPSIGVHPNLPVVGAAPT